MGFLEPSDPAGRGVEENPLPGLGRLDADADREVGLPVPGGPSRTTFLASERNTPMPRCAMRFRSAEGW
jgi:hypothetical protein